LLCGWTVGCEVGWVLVRFRAEVSMSSSTIGCPTEEREVLDVAGTALSGEAIALHPGSPVEQVAADDWLIAVDVVVKQCR
jgi:hypothetical protein